MTTKIDYQKRLRADLARRIRAFRVELQEAGFYAVQSEHAEEAALLVEAGQPWKARSPEVERVDYTRRLLGEIAADPGVNEELQEKAAQLCNALSDERRRRVKRGTKKKGEDARQLDITIGRLRVRCAAAVAADPENCLGRDEHDVKLEAGDLLLEEGRDEDWVGAVVIRSADREELARAVAPRPAP